MRNSDKEDTSVLFRSDRIQCENGFFYFATREGSIEGPYLSRQQAEVAAALYIRHHLDPTKVESMKHEPDPHIHRYTEREVADRRERDRREHDRRSGERRWKAD